MSVCQVKIAFNCKGQKKSGKRERGVSSLEEREQLLRSSRFQSINQTINGTTGLLYTQASERMTRNNRQKR